MSEFCPKISKQLLDKIVLYMNDRPYKEVAGLLSELYGEVQRQVARPKAVKDSRVDKMIRNTTKPPSSNGHYAKVP